MVQDDGESASVSNLALLNSYNGINFNSPRGKKLTVENIYITAFGTGFNIVRCTDRVILENVNLSPIYWINSSLTEKSEGFSSDLIEYLADHSDDESPKRFSIGKGRQSK